MEKKEELYGVYRDAIRRRVCDPCLDGTDDGSCGTGRLCAIDVHLPGVVDAIMAVDSDRIADYMTAIEAQVCWDCERREPSGDCHLRDSGDCALAAYLSLVVDAVGDVKNGAAS
jgi:hypothetical protein